MKKNIRFFSLLAASLLIWSSCRNTTKPTDMEPTNIAAEERYEEFDFQGHRGARGLAPENTIPAFLKALEYGVTTLELDVVFSEDGQIVISHEPWFNHGIALQPNGDTISEANERNFNLYKMAYEEIARFDVGSKGNARFSQQVKQKVAKPTLAMVAEAVTAYLMAYNLDPVFFNIETKTTVEGDNIFHPAPKEFVAKLYAEILNLGIEKYVTIQSFDVRTLEELHKIDSSIATALLVYHEDGSADDIEKSLATLSFLPTIYSPYYEYLTADVVEQLHEKGLQVIPWTVNETVDFQRLIAMDVDGLITDYPDRLRAFMNKK